MADALNEMNGPRDRAEELWIACARRVFPVPVSPRSTTGTSDLAARAASWRQRAIASLLVVRSSSFSWERGPSMKCERVLLPHAFAQLANGLEGVLDHRPSAYDDVRFTFHSYAQGQKFS